MMKLLFAALVVLSTPVLAQAEKEPWASGKPCKKDADCRELAKQLNDATTYICGAADFCVKGCRKDSDCKSGEQCLQPTACKGQKGCQRVCFQEARLSSTPESACLLPGNARPLWARR